MQFFASGPRLLLWATLAAAAQDRLPLVVRATSDFERVELSARPALGDALSCMQSQAGLLAATRPAERYREHYRKGYCTLIAAALRKDPAGYSEAAGEFEKAIAAWPPNGGGSGSARRRPAA
ncbi:MAG: hypothetical protein FJW37_05270, partial [Acidobacteria bacterium]|nr:hypothetical protein [Acidobacteriota bacterium]